MLHSRWDQLIKLCCVLHTCDIDTSEDATPQADQSVVENEGHGVPQHLCMHYSGLRQGDNLSSARMPQAHSKQHRSASAQMRTTPKPQNPAQQWPYGIKQGANQHAA
jgi:hypothetical protein